MTTPGNTDGIERTLAGAGDGAFVFGDDGRIRTWNRAAERLTIHLFRDVTASKELLTLIHERLGPTPGTEAAAPAGALSRRELDVLRLMTEGLNTAGIAERLRLSGATVRNHAQSIFAKLGVHSRLAAVAFAARHRLF